MSENQNNSIIKLGSALRNVLAAVEANATNEEAINLTLDLLMEASSRLKEILRQRTERTTQPYSHATLQEYLDLSSSETTSTEVEVGATLTGVEMLDANLLSGVCLKHGRQSRYFPGTKEFKIYAR